MMKLKQPRKTHRGKVYMKKKYGVHWLILLSFSSLFTRDISLKRKTKIECYFNKIDQIHEDIFAFVKKYETAPLSPDIEHSLTLLIRLVPKKAGFSSRKEKRFQLTSSMSYHALLKKTLAKMERVQHHYLDKVSTVSAKQFFTLQEKLQNTLAFISKTEGYFYDFYTIHEQKESATLKAIRSLGNIMIIILGIDCIMRLYVVSKFSSSHN